MIINRYLKNANWEFNDETGELVLETANFENGKYVGYSHITLNRTYAFSLARFLIRVFFRMSMKRKPKIQVETSKSLSETLNTSHTTQQQQPL